MFQQGNQLFAHRVLIPSRPSGEPGLLTKGDNVLLPDPPVRLEQVIGRVAMIQRGNQQLSLETTTWRRLGHAIALMMLVFYIIDRYNSAMNFINNDIFKMLLLIFSLLVIVSSFLTIRDHRRAARYREQIWQEKAALRSHVARPDHRQPPNGAQAGPSQHHRPKPRR